MKPWWTLVVMAGCAGTEMPPAENAVRAFAEHVRAHRDEEAFRLFSARAQSTMSREDFASALELDREEIAARAERAAAEPPHTEAVVHVEGGEPIVLVETEDGWRIRSGVPSIPNARTPASAGLAFRSALMSGNLSAILNLLSRSRRHEVEAEMRRVAAALGDEDGHEVVERAQGRATLRLSGGLVVELVLENGEWRVDSWQ